MLIRYPQVGYLGSDTRATIRWSPSLLVDCSVNNSTNCFSACHLVSCWLVEEEQRRRGRYPVAYRLKAADRRSWEQVASEGQVLQRVAKRAQALLALGRGERILEVVHWTGLRRTRLWRLWQRSPQRGAGAIFAAPRRGRPGGFSLPATGHDRTYRLHGPQRLRAAPVPGGLSQLAAGRGGAGCRRF
jgi:hypothetical protein